AVQGEAVLVGVDSHRADAELVGRAEDADGDLAAVGDEQPAHEACPGGTLRHKKRSLRLGWRWWRAGGPCALFYVPTARADTAGRAGRHPSLAVGLPTPGQARLQDYCVLRPVVGQLGKASGFSSGEGALGIDREMDPAATLRTAADEAGVVPPGAYERVVDGRPVVVEAEIDRLHPLPTA